MGTPNVPWTHTGGRAVYFHSTPSNRAVWIRIWPPLDGGRCRLLLISAGCYSGMRVATHICRFLLRYECCYSDMQVVTQIGAMK